MHDIPTADTRVIVIGASAGGVHALKTITSGLPRDIDAAVFVVLHIAATGPGLLPEILTSAGPLPASHPQSGQRLERGRIYVAPPDSHMLIDAQACIRLSHGPKENLTRPAIDPLFRSAALAFGPGVIGVVLTGNLNDGTAGLFAIKECGGITIVQDPADAEVPSMPMHAAQRVQVDHCVRLSEIATLLARLSKEKSKQERRVMPDKNLEIEVDIAAGDQAFSRGVLKLGDPSLFTCPECHGTLIRLRDQNMFRFRCHTGHGFTAEVLDAALDESAEEAIWNAVRALQEGAMLLEHLAEHARDQGREEYARELMAKAQSKLQRAAAARHLALSQTPPPSAK